MTYVQVDKENGFMGPGIYYQCSDGEGIREIFKFLGLSSVMFSRGAKLTEEAGDVESVGMVVTTIADEDYAMFEEPMNGVEISGALTVMLTLEQHPNILNDLHSPTDIDHYLDHAQSEPVTKLFELIHHYDKGDHTVYVKRTLKPKQDLV